MSLPRQLHTYVISMLSVLGDTSGSSRGVLKKGDQDMKFSQRKPVNKRASAAHFRHAVGQTHPRNMAMSPRRGGWRL